MSISGVDILNKRATLRRAARAPTCSSNIRLSWHLPLHESLASSGLWETQPPHQEDKSKHVRK